MSDDVKPPAKPHRHRYLLALAAALLVGAVLGVVADRGYLWLTQRAPDERLIGAWAGLDGDITFRPDGTYESAPVATVTASGGVTRNKLPPYTAQYRWVDRGTIQVYVPILQEWVTWRLAFDGDQLSLLAETGAVSRYIRKK